MGNLKFYGWVLLKLIFAIGLIYMGVQWTQAVQDSDDLLARTNVLSLFTLVVLGLLFAFAFATRRAQMFWKIMIAVLTVVILFVFAWVDNKSALWALTSLSFWTLICLIGVLWDEIVDWHDRFDTKRQEHRRARAATNTISDRSETSSPPASRQEVT